MAVKLKLVLRNPLLLSLLKPFIFGLLLFLVFLWNFNLLAVAIFFLGNFLLYIHPLISSFVYATLFLVLIIWSLLFLGMIAGHFWFSLIAIVFFSVLFYVIIGLKNFYLIDKNYWYYLLHNCLIYLVFLFLFFRTDLYFSGKLILSTTAIFFLVREFIKIFNLELRIQGSPLLASKGDPCILEPEIISRNIFAGVIMFLSGELIWVVSWLPLSFINATNLSFLLLYFLEIIILS